MLLTLVSFQLFMVFWFFFFFAFQAGATLTLKMAHHPELLTAALQEDLDTD